MGRLWFTVERELRVQGEEKHVKPSAWLWFPQASHSRCSLKARKVAANSPWLQPLACELVGAVEPGYTQP